MPICLESSNFNFQIFISKNGRFQALFSFRRWYSSRGVRYIDEKLSKADKSVFLKLSATYRYRKMEILKLSKNYRYRKMHQIWSDKYMKSISIRQLISANFYPKNARKITHSCTYSAQQLMSVARSITREHVSTNTWFSHWRVLWNRD